MNPSSFDHTIPWSIFKKLVLFQIIVILSVVVSSILISRYYLTKHITAQMKEQLVEISELAKQTIYHYDISPNDWCYDYSPPPTIHLTLSNSEGIIICERGSIESTNVNLYESMKVIHTNEGLPDETYILRLGVSLTRLDKAIESMDKMLIRIFLPLIFILLIITLALSFSVVRPLKSLLEKVDKIRLLARKKSEQGNYNDISSDRWIEVEHTLDQVKEDIEQYINELFNENTKITTLMESISDSILAVDKSGLVLFANRHFKKNFATVTDSRLKKTPYWEITRNLNIHTLIKRALEENNIIKMRSHPVKIQTGDREYFYDITVSPLKDFDQKVFGVVCVLHDVTERIKADQMREDFVTNVSHEVRTPLTALKGHVQILQTTELNNNDSIAHSLKTIEKNSDRLAILFQDILNLSVIESKQKITKEKISTQEITESVLTNVKQSYPEKPMQIEKDFTCEYIWADSQLLEQVLTNLIDNAYKYTPKSGKIKIEWFESEDSIKLQIHDNSEPIAKEHHARLFERFYRVDSSRSRELGGTGLGLAIVKHIVQKHRGQIKIQESCYQGNAFIIEFPNKKNHDEGPRIDYI